MLDKENLRQWLLRERSFSGNGPPPEIPDDVRIQLAMTYADAYERITGETPRVEVGDVEERIGKALL